MSHAGISYSEKYYDDKYEYRHVILPKAAAKKLKRDKLLSEAEWRSIGIQMSRGWVHYAWHDPEPNILLFKREFHGTTPRVCEEMKIQEHKRKMHTSTSE